MQLQLPRLTIRMSIPAYSNAAVAGCNFSHVGHAPQNAFIENRHAVANQLDFLQDMAIEKNRLAMLFELFQIAADLRTSEWIESVGRLVENEQLRIVQHRLGQTQ